jgi:hypothetical protein
LAEDKFGFRRSKGTGEAIKALRFILAKRTDRNMKTCMAFVDLKEAYGNMDWNRIFEILKKIGVRYKDRRIIYGLHKNQTEVVKCDGIEKEARIKRGVR